MDSSKIRKDEKMSLDVSLILKDVQGIEPGNHIFVREDGQVKELTRAEWDTRFPGREPLVLSSMNPVDEVYSANITHNLNHMAAEAGIYQALWRPEEIGLTKASQLIEPLRAGLKLLRNDPERFEKLNPDNGWGNYEGLVRFVENYLEACEKYPDAEIEASR
jgi:hypothetical protein